MVAVALEPGGAFNLASAALMLTLSVALLALDPTNRVSRAFAWFLLARGGLNVLDGVAFPPADALVNGHYSIATLFLGLWFAHEFRRRYAHRGAHARTTWLLLGAGLAAEAALLLRPHAWVEVATGRLGPLAVLDALRLLSYALIALVLLADAARAAPGPSRDALGLAGVGFAVFPAFVAGRALALWGRGLAEGTLGGTLSAMATDDPWRLVAALVTLLLVVPAVGLLVVRLARHGLRFAAAALAVVAAATSILTLAYAEPSPQILAMDGLTTLVLPLLVGYALLRHRLFDLDVKVKWTISRGSVAGVFLAVFFVVTQVAEVYLQQYGTLVGGVAAGLLLFAISPLQRMGERIASAAMPHAKRATDMDLGEREHAYRDMATLAWGDGALTGAERDLLDAAQARLGIPLERAMEIEREARAAAADA